MKMKSVSKIERKIFCKYIKGEKIKYSQLNYHKILSDSSLSISECENCLSLRNLNF